MQHSTRFFSADCTFSSLNPSYRRFKLIDYHLDTNRNRKPKMESLAVRRLICTYTPYATVMPRTNPLICTPIARIGARNRFMSFVLCAKKSNFQDFQGYTKPARLLPAHEVKANADSSLENVVKSFDEDKLECLYKLTVQTSNFYGSGLTDFNSGILLCLVDENGDSILQRIAATSSTDSLHFQRGSVDHFTFHGPVIGKLKAIWIGLESGQWRPANVSVICWSKSPPEENNNRRFRIFRYSFTTDDILLGDGNDISMLELKPNVLTELSNNNLTQNQNIPASSLSNEESMKEYADLKISLLLYDALLIITGSTIASFSAGENAAFAFLTGGIGGFLYLLLLQRSVDELPSPVLDRTGGLDKMFGRFKGQVTTLVLGLTFVVIVAKVGSGDQSVVFTRRDVVVGMMGFLSSKIAVVLAAFKPLPVGAKEGRW